MNSKEINASIITIGDELLIGQTIDTNSAFIAKELNKIGVWVKKRIAVGDIKEDILETLERESQDNKLIIITGGLGPTADDITKPALAEYFNSKLVENEEVLQNIKDIFEKLNRPLIERNLKQAEVPNNCVVLKNKRGTAPGMWFEKDNVIYISLPGVPHEMQGIFEEVVLEKLKTSLSLNAVLHKNLLTAGKGEAEVAEVLINFENSLPPHIKLAYLPAYGMVKLRLTGKGSNKESLEEEMNKEFKSLQKLVKEWLVSDEDKYMSQILGDLLMKRKKFMATAESCTGGYIAHLLTENPGSSSTFKGGVVCYANDAKEKSLGVQHETLVKYGAVSEETVSEMAAGALEVMTSDYAIATSGIMGPDGGTKEKPVGTVWIAVADKKRIVAKKHFVRFDRKRNIELTANIAMNMMRLFILEEEAKEG